MYKEKDVGAYKKRKLAAKAKWIEGKKLNLFENSAHWSSAAAMAAHWCVYIFITTKSMLSTYILYVFLYVHSTCNDGWQPTRPMSLY